MTRLIAHVDLNAFFASVEAKFHPEWKGEPIIVGVYTGRSEESGVVSSATYDARALGVKAGLPLAQAKKLCPHGHFVPVRHDTYSQLSEQVFLLLYPYSDAVEQASVDEAYADLTQKANGSFDTAEKMLREFQAKVKKELGLGCSIGLGPNKLVAKIASDFQKPNGFTRVEPENVQTFLDALPVKELLGVGPKTLEQLHAQKLETIADLRMCALKDLLSWFGQSKGNYLFAACRGIDESPLEPEREKKQHSRIWTLKKDISTLEEGREEVDTIAHEMWQHTAGKGNYFTQVGVIGIDASLAQSTKSASLNIPFVTFEQFHGEIIRLFEDLFAQQTLPLRRMGIRVSGFSSIPKQKRLGDF